MTAQIRIEGLVQIIITPFHADGTIDFDSLARLTQAALDEGASALTVLGVSSEAAYLDEEERHQVVRGVLEVNRGSIPLVVGISGTDAALVAARATEAEHAGAAAVMVAPPQEGATLVDHYAAVAAAAPTLSIVVQDFPPFSHARLEPATLAALSREVETVAAIYHEDPPTPTKIEAVLALAPDVPQIGGLGGLWLPWELRAGSRAVMTGFAFPEFMAAIVSAARSGDWARAFAIHELALPLIAWEAQPTIGLAHRKAMLVERGLIEGATVRAPLPATPRADVDAAELASALASRQEQLAEAGR